MAKAVHVPAWLARRTYFKRIGRWLKAGKDRGPDPALGTMATQLASNVVPFPVRGDRLDPPNFTDRRSIGIA